MGGGAATRPQPGPEPARTSAGHPCKLRTVTDSFQGTEYLGRADLGGANLGGANLTHAWLDGANLYGAKFYGANLSGATWPLKTQVPQGWARDPATGQLNRANAGASNSP